MPKKILFVLFVLGMFLVSNCGSILAEEKAEEVKIPKTEQEKREDLYNQIELFSYALTTVQSEYVEEKEAQDIIYGALKGMLGSLDPHSQFLNPEDYDELKTETQGKFGGLGIEITLRDSVLTVVTPIEDTPAWEAGLKAGDKIVKIEDDLTRDITLNEAVKKLRGDPGTDVTITILRESENLIKEVTITRAIIKIQDVKDVHVIDDGIGYIRLVEFREDSFKEFHKAIEQLKEDGAEAVILDLRNNPGGLLNVAIKITEEFVPEGETIVSTKGRHPSQDSHTLSRNKALLVEGWPIVVLINEGSASGSEILAGALKDHKRAVILGSKSFGKGSVQSVIPMPDGSGLRLTTAKYFTPSGVSIHGVGIEPDIEVKRIYKEIEEDKKVEKEKGEKVDKIFDNVEEKEEDPVETERLRKIKRRDERMLNDNQIQSAISVIKGIRVYERLSDN